MCGRWKKTTGTRAALRHDPCRTPMVPHLPAVSFYLTREIISWGSYPNKTSPARQRARLTICVGPAVACYPLCLLRLAPGWDGRKSFFFSLSFLTPPRLALLALCTTAVGRISGAGQRRTKNSTIHHTRSVVWSCHDQKVPPCFLSSGMGIPSSDRWLQMSRGAALHPPNNPAGKARASSNNGM